MVVAAPPLPSLPAGVVPLRRNGSPLRAGYGANEHASLPAALRVGAPPFPRVVRAADIRGGGGPDAGRWGAAVRAVIDEQLVPAGALLLRGIPALRGGDVAAFDRLCSATGYEWMQYIGGAAARKKLGAVVSTTNFAPPEVTIDLHSEMAYQRPVPSRVLFFCAAAPPLGAGGETPIAHTADVLARLPPEVRDEFRRRGGCGTLHFKANTPGLSGRVGGGSWQSSFQTEDRAEAAARALAGGHYRRVEFNRRGHMALHGDALPAEEAHPVTGETTWLNSVSVLSVIPGEEELTRGLVARAQHWEADDGEVGDIMRRLGRLRVYGDMTPVPEEVVWRIKRAQWEAAVAVQYERGDVLVLDNHAVQHGRLSMSCPLEQRRLVAALVAPRAPRAAL